MREVVIIRSGISLCRAEVATSPWSRSWGLLGRDRLPEDQGLWIRPCKAIHTFFMRFPIDVVFLAPDGTVIKTKPDLKAFRFSAGGRGSHSVVELPGGLIARHQLSVGDQLELATADQTSDPMADPMESSSTRYPRFWRRQNRQAGIAGTLAGFACLIFDALSFPVAAFLLGVGLGLVGLVHPLMQLARLADRATRQRLMGINLIGLVRPPAQLYRRIARATRQSLPGLGRRLRRVYPARSAVSTGLRSIYDLVTDLSNPQLPLVAQTLTILMVTGPEFLQSFQLGDQPGTIGAALSSSVHLPAAPGVAGEHARFWWRDRQLMLHHVATNQVTRVNGKQVIWASLEEGDEVWIGPYRVQISRISQDESVPGRRDSFARVP
ncbi:MAG TPA: DUF192 domain-containing protein [Dehalococcoidia bacterium]|nr:DUF192 domain-containing protein [Dehalococcoidia bacterium]